jgi:hypothetical protein
MVREKKWGRLIFVYEKFNKVSQIRNIHNVYNNSVMKEISIYIKDELDKPTLNPRVMCWLQKLVTNQKCSSDKKK